MAGNRRIRSLNRWVESSLLMLLCSLFLLFGGCEKKQKAPPQSPPPEVTVEKVVLQTVPVHLNYVATTDRKSVV